MLPLNEYYLNWLLRKAFLNDFFSTYKILSGRIRICDYVLDLSLNVEKTNFVNYKTILQLILL